MPQVPLLQVPSLGPPDAAGQSQSRGHGLEVVVAAEPIEAGLLAAVAAAHRTAEAAVVVAVAAVAVGVG